MSGDFLINELLGYAREMDFLEILGLATGLLAVWWLIKQNILTWPVGIIYVLASLIIFWRERLYADFALHIFYLGMNIYGWHYWKYGKKTETEDLPVTRTSGRTLFTIISISIAGILITGYALKRFTDAALPYWDSATTILSLSGMWLTARKKIENWHFWLTVDVMATAIYYYKGIYFYSFLYLIYIALAVSGYISWKTSMEKKSTASCSEK